MKFIPLTSFFNFLNLEIQVVESNNRIEEIKKNIHEKYRKLNCIQVETEKIELSDALDFCKVLRNPAIIVFDQWISQTKNLKNTLLRIDWKAPEQKKMNHELFLEYTNFLSPFLLPILMDKLKNDVHSDYFICSKYLDFLNEDSKLILQHKLNEKIKSSIETSLKNINAEYKLITTVDDFLSDEYISMINQFSKRFYTTKIDYLDKMLNLIKHEYSTPTIAFRVVNQLSKLNLNKEHLEKIAEIKQDIKEGKIKFKTKRNSINSKKTFIGASALILIATFVVFLLANQDLFLIREDKSEKKKLSSRLHN
jgi:hypothetical protein